MANRNRARGGTATAARPQPQNTATEPAAEVARADDVLVVETPDFQVDDVDFDPTAITMLGEDPDDPDGLRIGEDFDDGSPVLDMKGNPIEVQDLADDESDYDEPEAGYVETGNPEDESEVLAAARRMMAEAQEMRAQAERTLAQAQAVATTPQPKQGLVARARQAVVQDGPTIVEAPAQKSRVVRVREDVGPVFYGSPDRQIHLLKGYKYKVPEDIYEYLRERDLIWAMG